jgi:hypothetical protein
MYPLTLELVDFLLSNRAKTTLDQLIQTDVSDATLLPQLTALRRDFTPPEAAALLDQARLRQRARAKFPYAERLFFTDEALQQASSFAIASYRAKYFAGYRCVADLGCGIGGDMLALAQVVPQIIAVERDPVRARIAEVNAAAGGVSERVRVVCADWTTLSLDVEAAFADPSRRTDERRVFRLAEMEPPIAAIHALRERITNVAVKVAPGVSHEKIPSDAEVEFISERRTCKEALLLFGDLQKGVSRTATLLPGPHHLDSSAPISQGPACEPKTYLYEPDPAILRAGLVRALASQLNAVQIDATIAYLTSDKLAPTPFARVWRVVRHGPFHLKTLNRWLRELGAGDVVVKKRGSPIDPDAFRRRLKTTPGGPILTVFLTHVRERPWMVVGESCT